MPVWLRVHGMPNPHRCMNIAKSTTTTDSGERATKAMIHAAMSISARTIAVTIAQNTSLSLRR